jgi:hypothetical protein
MVQAMNANVPFRPINIGTLGADGVMLVPDASAQLIEQTRLPFAIVSAVPCFTFI